MNPAREILARVQRTHPNDTSAQRRMLTRWAGILRAKDPYLAATLLSLRLVGSSNDARGKAPAC